MDHKKRRPALLDGDKVMSQLADFFFFFGWRAVNTSFQQAYEIGTHSYVNMYTNISKCNFLKDILQCKLIL